MADSRQTSQLVPSGGHNVDSGSVRPRNRRLISADSHRSDGLATARSSSSLFSSFSTSASRKPSPASLHRSQLDHRGSTSTKEAGGSDDSNGPPDNHLGIFENSLTQSWTTIQSFASSLMSHDPATSSSASRDSRPKTFFRTVEGTRQRRAPESWGPSPPDSRPAANDLGVGGVSERQAALRTARTASVLESHEGVNGGLDVSGRYKRRTSDEYNALRTLEETELDQLVYIHHVQPTDTYAGIVLRYRCREEPFRRLNGLWSKDIQARKWLALPVDYCEIKGRATRPPSQRSEDNEDLLVPTTDILDSQQSGDDATSSDFVSTVKPRPTVGQKEAIDDKPWQHVRWCSLDMFSQPVEIARVSRKAMGYFPPRRKKSLHTTSVTSTPRQSLDFANNPTISDRLDSDANGENLSPNNSISESIRRDQMGTTDSPIAATSRGRLGSSGGDLRPAWMRGPGGVGSMGRNVRAPGPEKDYLNTWAKRHLPAIAIDENTPSISVMGSETAHFGFGRQGQEPDAATIVQSPFDEGRGAPSSSPNNFGLDRAAAHIETWLRGAFAKRPVTPGRSDNSAVWVRRHDDMPSDLIELEDAPHDEVPATSSLNVTDPRPVDLDSTGQPATETTSSGRAEYPSRLRSRK